MRNGRAAVALLAVVVILAPAGAAQASVTIGSNLTAPADDVGCAVTPCTIASRVVFADHLAPGGLASPVTGTVTSWRFKAMAAGYELNLRVLRPAGGDVFTGAGTSAVVTSTGGIQGPVATSLPINAGDQIGLNAPAGASIVCDCGAPTAALKWTAPPLADGETRTGSTVVGREVMVQATVEPTNQVGFGAVSRNKKRGTAQITLNVPNGGTLAYGGSRVSVAGPNSLVVGAPIKVTVSAKGKSKKKLKKKGKVKVGLNVTFTPTGGTAAASATKVKLLKSSRHRRNR